MSRLLRIEAAHLQHGVPLVLAQPLVDDGEDHDGAWQLGGMTAGRIQSDHSALQVFALDDPGLLRHFRADHHVGLLPDGDTTISLEVAVALLRVAVDELRDAAGAHRVALADRVARLTERLELDDTTARADLVSIFLPGGRWFDVEGSIPLQTSVRHALERLERLPSGGD